MVQPDSPQITIWHTRSTCRITKPTDTQSMQYLLLFHVDNGYANAPQHYIQCHVHCLLFSIRTMGATLYDSPLTFLGAFKYAEHLTKRCYRTEAHQRPEFLKCKSPADWRVQVSSLTGTVTICSAEHWATASERSSNR